MTYVTLILGLLQLAMDLRQIQKKVEEGGVLTKEDKDKIELAEQMEMLRLGKNTGHEGEVL